MNSVIFEKDAPRVSVLGLFGESVFMQVDHFHAPGETLHASGLYAEPGGKGYNQAVAAQRLGAAVTFYGCGGEDKSCDACAEFLDREGIVHHIERTKNSASSYACILTDKEGANRVTVYRGAADDFSPEYMRRYEDEIEKADILLINYEYPDAVNEAAVDMAMAHGVRVILNPAPAHDMPVEWVKRCWLVTPNEQEAAALLDMKGVPTKEELARAFVEQGFVRSVVTLGGDGALLVEEGEAWHLQGLSAQVVDTTGAGDTFNAALAAAVGKGAALKEAAAFAMNAAALSIEHKYVMPGLPTLKDVKAHYRSVKVQKLF